MSLLTKVKDQEQQAGPASGVRDFLQWLALLLQPGIGIKRWVALGTFGVLLIALGIAFVFSVPVSAAVLSFGRTLTLGRFVTGIVRGAVIMSVGSLIIAASSFMLYKRVAFGARYQQNGKVIENLRRYRLRSAGPKVVAIGGGTGLSSLLRGLKNFTHDITAVVTVADDGGSSGRLREELGISPPGDARQCLVALSESEPLMEEVLSYRFVSGEGLEGHNLGNLLLAALVHTRGSFHDAVQAAATLLAVRGKVVPSSTSPDLRLMAVTERGVKLAGESAIGHAGEAIEDLWVEPPDAPVNTAALEAIAAADIVVIGPGSLYTSILPNFLVPGISEAVTRSRAPNVLVCNIATQHGETDGLSATDHLRVFQRYSGVSVTHFLVNNRPIRVDEKFHQEPVTLQDGVEGFDGVAVRRDLVDVGFPTRHDPLKLAGAIIELARLARRPS